jgi:hypothetical protein
MAVLSCLCFTDCPVLAVLFQLYCSACLVPPVWFCLSGAACPFLAVLSFLSCLIFFYPSSSFMPALALFWQPCLGSHVWAALSWQPCPGHPFLVVLPWQSYPGSFVLPASFACQVLPVQFCLSCPPVLLPVLPVLICLSHSFYPVLPVLF